MKIPRTFVEIRQKTEREKKREGNYVCRKKRKTSEKLLRLDITVTLGYENF